MSLKLAARFVGVSTRKIADLQENDTDSHELDISAYVPPGTKAVLIRPARQAGAGNFLVYPMSHATEYLTSVTTVLNFIPIIDRTIKWKNTVANDDWDLYLNGYFVQKVTR